MFSILSRSGEEAVPTRGGDGAIRDYRARHVGRLLLRAHRAFSASAAARLRERGYDDLTLAHINLLPHLDHAGTRITTLAERAGMTKQGTGQLVHDLERSGFLTRSADPTDRRATLVRFTATGLRLLSDAMAVTAELEAEYAAILGETRLREMKQMLEALVTADERHD